MTANTLPAGVAQTGEYADGTPRFEIKETCHRCGGAGGADYWPGFTCFECGGSGAGVYLWVSPERQAKLDAKSSRDLERTRQREAAAAAELFEGDTAIAEWFAFGWQPDAPVQLDELSLDILNKTVRKGRTPSDKQIELLRNRYDACVEATVVYAEDEAVQWFLDGSGIAAESTIRVPNSDWFFRIKSALRRRDPLSVKQLQSIHELHEVQVGGKVEGEFFGEVKGRYDLTLTVVKQVCLPDYGYGSSSLYIMKDAEGRTFTWKTSTFVPAMSGCEGETVTLKGTVKEHVEYGGVNQTALTRCKIVEAS